MIIENVAASFPTRKVGNEEVVDLIRFHSKDFEGDLSGTLRTVQDLLDQTGLIERHWQSTSERPIGHLDEAVSSAIRGSGLQPADIDLFIYVGAGGGFREPGNSYMVAKSLGVVQAECFDVVDSSMSWTRALSLVDSLFKTGGHRTALVVNGEFNMTAGNPLFPASFSLRNPSQLAHALPSYSLGEAATATLLRAHQPDNFRFQFRSRPDLADLFPTPGSGYAGLRQEADGAGQPGLSIGSAGGHPSPLAQAIMDLLSTGGPCIASTDIVFTHTAPLTALNEAAQRHGFAEKLYHLYPHTGNIVSASIPAALARAKADGSLNAGDEVLFLMGVTGMSIAAVQFEH